MFFSLSEEDRRSSSLYLSFCPTTISAPAFLMASILPRSTAQPAITTVCAENCFRADRANCRDLRSAFAVMVHECITDTSEGVPKGTTLYPASLNCPAMIAVSAWFSLHPTVLNDTVAWFCSVSMISRSTSRL